MGRNPGKRSIEFTSDRRALLEQLMKERGAAVRPAATIPRRGETGPAPLSFTQQRLWFLDQLVPGNPFYNIPLAVRYPAWLNVPVLERSLNALVRRHETLRTSFIAHEGIPRQHIAADLAVALPVVDLRGLPLERREAEALRLATEEARRPFDLERGPLLRATLLQLGEAGYIFLLTIHHIIADRWSLQVFARELFELYKAFTAGLPSPLPELPIQYADYAVWQRETLRGESLEGPLNYWKQRLAGLPVLDLPTDHQRPPISSFRGDEYDHELSPTLAARLKSLTQQAGATLYMTLLAAFTAQLYRCTGQEDIVVGMPVAGRSRAELEGLIGFFVNTLVLRVDHAGDPTFRTLLDRVKEATVEAQAHQEVPFEKLVEELKPERDLSRNPLCQVTFQLFNAPPGSDSSNGRLPAGSSGPAALAVKRGSAVFDLALTVWENGPGLTCRYEFSTDLFEPETIARMGRHFETLLEGAALNPDLCLSELPLLGEAEREALLSGWNATAAGYDRDACLHTLFERQVERTPQAAAVMAGGEPLTYAELNRRANQLAHYLQSIGARPDDLIAVSIDRSAELVIALLGILKAGAGYVPLDPAYPQERLRFMVQDSRPAALITERKYAGRFSPGEAAVICLDEDREKFDDQPEDNPDSQAAPETIAYVIYTSGSTGLPKGVMIPHRAICNHMLWMQQAFPLQPDDRVIQRTPASFDASVWEFWAPLLCGACLVVPDLDPAAYTSDLVEAIARRQVTVVQVVPTLLKMMLDEPGFQNCRSLKRVFCGGEALSAGLQQRFAAASSAALINLYGPTEATIDATFHLCTGNGTGETEPIGRPVSNMQAYVLDRHLNPVPVGVPGELYLGGVGLARGYLGRPALTAKKFIPNPFSQAPGARLYRTGDRVRWLPGGRLEFLGRMDHQVKLRGYRIELGEIEAALRQHPEVREAVALVREDAPGDKRLAAYVVPKEAPGPTVSELRSHLKQGLPEYMLPAAFVLMDELPLTPNGKVDRRALPPPDAARPELESGYLAPSTPAEETLAGIWAKVLGLKQVGVNDNFFDLGGDSILSIQIVTQANQAGLHLTPRLLFQHQTIAELALAAGMETPIAAEQGPVSGEVPLTPIQRWFFEQDLAGAHHFNQSMMLEVGPGLAAPALEAAVRGLVEHHDALRLRFHRQMGGWRQEHAAPGEGESPFLYVDLSGLDEAGQRAEIERIAARQQAGLDLSQGPLLRAVYFNRGPARSGRLLLVIHHLVVDGVSWRILLEDLWLAYQQLSRGEALHLPPKTTSYQYWARRLEQYVREGGAAEELEAWLALAGRRAPPIPLDIPGGENSYADSRLVTVSLTPEETQALLRQVPKAFNAQVNEALLAALVEAFAGWTGERALLVDLEGHGREALFDEIDLTRTAGWFTSIFPAYLDLGEASGPVEALRAIQEQLRSVPNHGIGFGLLRYLNPDPQSVERLKVLPQPEVIFNYLGRFGPAQPEEQPLPAPLESKGPEYSPAARRRHLLEINASVSAGRLNITWMYSSGLHHAGTVEWLAQAHLEALRLLIAASPPAGEGGFTPADFPDVQLSQEKLDTILSELGLSFDEDGTDEEQNSNQNPNDD